MRVFEAINVEEDIIQMKIVNGPKHPKMIANIFEILRKNEINIDMISQVTNQESAQIEITCESKFQKQLNKAIVEITDAFNNIQIYLSKKFIKIALGGELVATTPGAAAQIFQVLGENNIHFMQITTSKRTVSVLIDKKDKDYALKKLQERFLG